MGIDEEKLGYIHLLLDEPIYVLKDKQEVPVQLPETIQPVKVAVPTPPTPVPVKTQPVHPPQVTPPVKKPQPVNRNKVMILFFNEQSPYLKKNEEVLLKKILTAVHLKLEDVDLVNLNNIRRIDYIDILKDKVLNQLISFGISLTELNLQIHLIKYQMEKIEGIDILLADSLSVLEHDQDLKKQLWKCLKEMFAK
jgi:DNA polymerase III psi subunit